MSSLNRLNCATAGANLGLADCFINMDLIVGAIAIPKGYGYTATQLVDFQATLRAQAINNTYANRVFIMGQFLEIDDQSEDVQMKTWGYGAKTLTRDETMDWVFPFLDGGMCRFKQMKRFNNTQNKFDFIFVDKSGTFWGTTGTDATTGDLLFKGVQLSQIFTYNLKAPDGSNTVLYRTKFSLLNPKQLNENAAYVVNTTFDPFNDIQMIQDVQLSTVGSKTASGSGVVNVAVLAGCGSANLVQLYGSTIAVAGMFDVVNTLTGAAIAITTVTIAGTGDNQYLVFDLDSADPDYPASGAYLTIKFKSVSAVFAILAAYYETQANGLQVAAS